MKCSAYARRTGKPCRREAVEGAAYCVFHGPEDSNTLRSERAEDAADGELAEVIRLAPPVDLSTADGCIRALEETLALLLQGEMGTRAADACVTGINVALRWHNAQLKARGPSTTKPEQRVISFRLAKPADTEPDA